MKVANKQEVPGFIKENGQRITFNKRDYIVRAGDKLLGIYYIEKGKSRYVVSSKDGKQKIMLILNPGNLFGEGPMLHQDPSLFYVEALEDVEILYLKKEQVYLGLKNDDEFLDYFLCSFYMKIKNFVSQLLDVCFCSAVERVCSTILDNAVWSDKINSYIFDLTQQEICEFLGVSRITVAREIRKLKERGIIKASRGTNIINNISALNHLANSLDLNI